MEATVTCAIELAEKRYLSEKIEDGITVMAVDNLPCELSKESSMFYSNVVREFTSDIVSADFGKTFDELHLPYPNRKALILHNGQ